MALAAALVMVAAASAPAQAQAVRTGAITGISAKCVEVNGGISENGRPVRIWGCNGTGAQQWTIGTDGTIQALGRCLDVAGGATAAGTPVQLWDCNGTGAQQWLKTSANQLVNPQSGACLDVTWANPAAGTPLQIWPCNGTVAQYWALPRGPSDPPPTFSITGNDQKVRFQEAVGTPQAIVRIAGNVNLDLSGLQGVVVAPGVQIIGDRSGFRGGPMLYTTTFPPLLLMIGDPDTGIPSDDVHISGIRWDGGEPGDPTATLGPLDADAIDIYSSQRVEIDHNEFVAWKGTAVNVRDPWGRLSGHNANTVWVHDNYMHHNQHPTADTVNPFGSGHGGGYGVNVADGAYALVEKNAFWFNRHSIAGSGVLGTGYLAYRNLFIGPGIDSIHDGIPRMNHMVDMHGIFNCGIYSYNCGLAGEYMDLAYNAFPSTDSVDIKLRGTPDTGMFVENNAFAHSVVWSSTFTNGAFDQTESGLIDAGGNLYGTTAWNSSRTSCDFDGDGINDTFKATGVSWWYASSAAANRWVYLNQSPRLVGAVTLGDVDGDGRCDVTSSDGVFLSPPPSGVSGPEIVFHASDNFLWQVAPNGTGRMAANGLGVASNTSPAAAALSNGGYEIAFQANGLGTLWTVDRNNHGHATNACMAPGSSPAIAALPGGGFEIVFAGCDHFLWETGPDFNGHFAANGLGVASNTSPAVAALVGGGFEIAFQANGLGTLWTVDRDNIGHATSACMAPGTSPAIAALPDGGFEIVFVGCDNLLWQMGPDLAGRHVASGLGVAPGTSPAIASRYTGAVEIAFAVAGSNHLWTVTPDGIAHDTGVAIAAGNSPGIAALRDGDFDIAFKNPSDGLLWEMGSDGIPRRSANGLGVAAHSAPAIASPVFALEAFPLPALAPNIVGRTRAQASGILADAGMQLGNERDFVIRDCGDGIGTILDQTPSAGAAVRGTSINFTFGVRPSVCP
jgi:hypothetical protein